MEPFVVAIALIFGIPLLIAWIVLGDSSSNERGFGSLSPKRARGARGATSNARNRAGEPPHVGSRTPNQNGSARYDASPPWRDVWHGSPSNATDPSNPAAHRYGTSADTGAEAWRNDTSGAATGLLYGAMLGKAVHDRHCGPSSPGDAFARGSVWRDGYERDFDGDHRDWGLDGNYGGDCDRGDWVG